MRHHRSMANDLPAHIQSHYAKRSQPDNGGCGARQRGLRHAHTSNVESFFVDAYP
jgi:hypothetical protein